MSLFTKLREAVLSWRRRRVGIKSRQRSYLAMEQLDHRQLLAVNFTGVAATDFPSTQNPGVQVVVPATNTTPGIPANLAGIINVSGIQINDLRVSYTAADDTLNVGLEGPPNGRAGQPAGQQVIAGDLDNNLNSATVDPRVTAIDPQFQDPADMGGSKTYGVFLDLGGSTTPNVVAGFPGAEAANLPFKPYQVALAASPTAGALNPTFNESALLPQYTGNYYLANNPAHGNFELQITHFSQLYQQITGNAFNTATSSVAIGAFGASGQNIGISDEFFPATAVNLPQATVPLPVVVPPVNMEPTVYVNPHQNYHINTAHSDAVRVTILGSSSFDPTTIIPSSVRFGDPATIATTGASPILNFENNVNDDEFPDETFVFNGINIKLPSGITVAEIAGTTTSGQNFESQVKVFNRDNSYYTPAQINAQQAAFAKYDAAHGISTANGLVPPPPKIPALAVKLASKGTITGLLHPLAGKAPKQVNPAAAVTATSLASPTFMPTSLVSIPTASAAFIPAAAPASTSASTGTTATASAFVPTSTVAIPTAANTTPGNVTVSTAVPVAMTGQSISGAA